MKLSDIEKKRFDAYVTQAVQASFQGWDFSYIVQFGGDVEEPHPWSYVNTVRHYLGSKEIVLDMGTGGGEFLASLKPLPIQTYATEAYPPNVPIAKTRLNPLGVTVIEVEEGVQENFPLPFENSFFEVIPYSYIVLTFSILSILLLITLGRGIYNFWNATGGRIGEFFRLRTHKRSFSDM